MIKPRTHAPFAPVPTGLVQLVLALDFDGTSLREAVPPFQGYDCVVVFRAPSQEL